MSADAERVAGAGLGKRRRPARDAHRVDAAADAPGRASAVAERCFGETCPSSGRAPNGRSSSSCSRRSSPPGAGGCSSSRASPAGPRCDPDMPPTARARPSSCLTTSGTCAIGTWSSTSRCAPRRSSSSSAWGRTVEPAVARAKRRTLATPSVGAALVLCLVGLGVDRPAMPRLGGGTTAAVAPDRPPARPPPPVTSPGPPAVYRVPAGALRVSTSAELRAALARHKPRRIVLAAGTYRSQRPFLNPYGHRLYAAKLGAVVLKAGLSLGGNQGRGGGLVRGIVFDVSSRSRTVGGAIVAVWGTGRNSSVLDSTLQGNRVVSAGIVARQPAGLIVRRVVARGFSNYGVVVDANELDPGSAAGRFWLSDLDVADVSRPVPGSSQGRAEACVWIGNSGSVRRVRADRCAWTGLWTGTATRKLHVRGHRHRSNTDRRVHRALHAHQRLPTPSRQAECPDRRCRRVGRPGLERQARERRQRHRRQPLRELARRRLPRRRHHSDDSASQRIRRTALGGDRRLPWHRERLLRQRLPADQARGLGDCARALRRQRGTRP